MSTENSESTVSVGKPWQNNATYRSFEEADEARKNLLEAFKQPEYEGMQVKVKRYPSGKFILKTRLHPDFEPKKEKKRGKNKRRDKKTSSKRESNTTTTV